MLVTCQLHKNGGGHCLEAAEDVGQLHVGYVSVTCQVHVSYMKKEDPLPVRHTHRYTHIHAHIYTRDRY